MKVTAEKTDTNKVKLEIHVDPETFERGMEKSYLKNRKNISIPGFRKGKVPRKIIERYYGEAIFYEDAVNEIFPAAYDEAVREANIEPVDRPEIDIVQIGSGQDLILTALVTVKPEVELGQYKGIEVTRTEYNVTDDDVDHQLHHVVERNARWISVERAVKEGDRVTLDYTGTIDGKEFPGGAAEKYILEIGSGHFIPGFEEQLTGMMPGEEKDINVTFPEKYHAEELQGKAAVFHVKIHEVKEKELPALDDEFAKDVSEFDTLDEYKADIKKRLVDAAEARSRNDMENELIRKVVDNAKVEIPDVMVENEIDDMVRDMDYRMRYNGLTLDQYLKMTNTTLDDLRAQFKEDAYNRVKTQLVLESIAKAENIEATDEDLEKEYARLADQYKQSIEEVKKNFANSTGYISNSIKVNKTIDFLIDNSVVTVKPAQDLHSEEKEN